LTLNDFPRTCPPQMNGSLLALEAISLFGIPLFGHWLRDVPGRHHRPMSPP
jgi:hypothetical protein